MVAPLLLLLQMRSDAAERIGGGDGPAREMLSSVAFSARAVVLWWCWVIVTHDVAMGQLQTQLKENTGNDSMSERFSIHMTYESQAKCWLSESHEFKDSGRHLRLREDSVEQS